MNVVQKLYATVRSNFELFCWIGSLFLLVAQDPTKEHFTFCLFHHLGISFCPGCGLGHAIGFLVRGEWLLSWQTHPLATFALIVLLYRIFQLLFTNKNTTNVKRINENDARFGN